MSTPPIGGPTSGQTRMRSLPITIAGIAGERGFRIAHRTGLEFAVDLQEKTIFVPTLNTIGSDEDALMLEGGVDHELMHVRQTDPTVETDVPNAHDLCNVIEDPRGEVGYFEILPGARRNIETLLNLLSRRGGYGTPSEDNPFDVLSAFLLFELRAEIGQTNFSSLSRQPTRELAERLFGANAQRALDLALPVVRHERGKQGTRKAMDAALAILALFGAASEEPQPASSTSSDKTSPPSGSTPPQSSGTGPSEDRDGPGGQPTGNNPGKQPSCGKKQPRGVGKSVSASQAATARAVCAPPVGPIGDYTKPIGSLILGKGGLKDGLEPTPLIDGRSAASDNDTRIKHSSDARHGALALGVRLDDLLQSFGLTSTRFARTGRFDPARAVLAACGNRRAFRRKTVSETLNTAICVVVDRSGSMNGKKDETDATPWGLARNTMFSLCTALDGIDVPFSIFFFNKRVELHHDFGDSWTRTMGRHYPLPRGGTSMAQAYMEGATALLSRAEERRILMLVSDGCPYDWTALEIAVAEAKSWGVESRTVLISPSEQNFQRFQKMGTVPAKVLSAHQIPTAIFRTMESALIADC